MGEGEGVRAGTIPIEIQQVQLSWGLGEVSVVPVRVQQIAFYLQGAVGIIYGH